MKNVFAALSQCETWIIALETIIPEKVLRECLHAVKHASSEERNLKNPILNEVFKQAVTFSSFPEGPNLMEATKFGKKVILTTRISDNDPAIQNAYLSILLNRRGIMAVPANEVLTGSGSTLLEKISHLDGFKPESTFIISCHIDDLNAAAAQGIKPVHFLQSRDPATGTLTEKHMPEAFTAITFTGGLLHMLRDEMIDIKAERKKYIEQAEASLKRMQRKSTIPPEQAAKPLWKRLVPRL